MAVYITSIQRDVKEAKLMVYLVPGGRVVMKAREIEL